jgi:hypothetical protein
LLVNGKGCRIIKKAVDPYIFATLPEVRALAKVGAFCTLGHTRLATQGAIKDRNAHPFQINQIVGTHNGIIFNWREILPTALVDSEAAFSILARKGTKGIPKLKGSAALVWINLQDHTLNLYRHDNPLHMLYVPSIATLFWSSEFAPLCAAVVGAGLVDWHERALDSDCVYTYSEYDPSLPSKPKAYKMQSWGWQQQVYGDDYPYDGMGGHKLWSKHEARRYKDERPDELEGVEVSGVCDWCQTLGSLRYFDEYDGWICPMCVSQLEDDAEAAAEGYVREHGVNVVTGRELTASKKIEQEVAEIKETLLLKRGTDEKPEDE